MNTRSDSQSIEINGRLIGPGHPVYTIAEMSANHGHDLEKARRILHAMKAAGADAVKLQTYTADTLTIDCDRPEFCIGSGTVWEGKNLYQLYEEAYTPWDWHRPLMEEATSLGLDFFSTPFDAQAVDLLEELNVPAYKIASFENIDLALIRLVASTGKPLIMSTGMASLAELDDAVRVIREAGCTQLALLKCTSAYPAPPDEMNLRTLPHLGEAFGVVTGLSDHTMGLGVPVASVTLGASIIEKHFTESRSDPGPDSSFSLEPGEFKEMVDAVRVTERALGSVSYEVTEKEKASKVFRRSLFVVEDVKKGESLTRENVRSIRPGHGLAPKHLDRVLGRSAARDMVRGTPLSWDAIH